MRKNIKFFVLGLALLVLGLASCDESNNIIGNKISYDEAYGCSVINGVNMFANGSLNVNLSNKMTSENYENAIKNLSFIDKCIESNSIKNEEKTSDREGYSKMNSITTTFLNEQTEEYILYFNEVEKYSEDEEDKKTYYEGIIVNEEKEYKIKGIKKEENDEDEIENKILFTIYKSECDYVVVKQETEQENDSDETESEYKLEYTQYVDGKKKQVVEVEMEKESGEMTYEIFRREDKDKARYRFKFMNEKDEEYISVTVKESNDKCRNGRIDFNVNEDGTVSYIYESDEASKENNYSLSE